VSVLGTPGEELSKEEKNLAIMAMKKKLDKRLYDRIMHSKKKKRSEVKLLSSICSNTIVGQAGQSDKIEISQRR